MEILLFSVNSTMRLEIELILVEYLPLKVTGVGTYGVRVRVFCPDEFLSRI